MTGLVALLAVVVLLTLIVVEERRIKEERRYSALLRSRIQQANLGSAYHVDPDDVRRGHSWPH